MAAARPGTTRVQSSTYWLRVIARGPKIRSAAKSRMDFPETRCTMVASMSYAVLL
jgi:hypothetical protein